MWPGLPLLYIVLCYSEARYLVPCSHHVPAVCTAVLDCCVAVEPVRAAGGHGTTASSNMAATLWRKPQTPSHRLTKLKQLVVTNKHIEATLMDLAKFVLN